MVPRDPGPERVDPARPGIPLRKLDLCLYARNEGLSVEAAAAGTGLEPGVVERVYADIDRKRRAAEYLHAPPLLVAPLERAGP